MRRVQMEVFNLDNPDEMNKFLQGNSRTIKVPGTDREVNYDDMKRIGITFSKMGASNAISAGAYAYALSRLDNQA